MDRRRAVDADPGDRFRGLYISDEQVDGLLGHPPGPLVAPDADEASVALRDALEAGAAEAERAGAVIRVRELATAFGLEPADVELLLVALAPDLDPRFERLYGYLHDDVSRRRASVGLALELCGGTATAGGAPIRDRLGPLAPLVAGRLLIIEDVDRPTLTRPLRVPDRVTAHLLGDDSPDPIVEALLATSVAVDVEEVDAIERTLAAGRHLVYVRERPGASGRSLGWTAMARLGRQAIALDLVRMSPADDPVLIAAAASREARLRGAGLVVGPGRVARRARGGRGARVRRAAGDRHPRRDPRLGSRLVPRAAADRRRARADRRTPSRAVGRVAQRRRAQGVRPRGRDDRVPPRRRSRSTGRRGPPARRRRRLLGR